MDPTVIGLIKKHFGQHATFSRNLFGVVHISSRYGELDIKKEQFVNLVGGSDLYRAALLFTAERWGSVRVSGTSDHILACMAHGKELGVNVVPEGDKKGSGCLALGFGANAFGLAILAGVILVPLGILDSFQLLELGAIGALVTSLVVYLPIKKALARDARRAGQKYRDIFPEIHGSERKADRNAARDRGLL